MGTNHQGNNRASWASIAGGTSSCINDRRGATTTKPVQAIFNGTTSAVIATGAKQCISIGNRSFEIAKVKQNGEIMASIKEINMGFKEFIISLAAFEWISSILEQESLTLREKPTYWSFSKNNNQLSIVRNFFGKGEMLKLTRFGAKKDPAQVCFFPAGGEGRGWMNFAEVIKFCLGMATIFQPPPTPSNTSTLNVQHPVRFNNRWKGALICEIQDKSIPWTRVAQLMKSTFKLQGSVSLSPITTAKTRALFFVDSEQKKKEILSKQEWVMNDVKMRITEWSPDANSIKSQGANIPKPVWLMIHGVPLHIWNLQTYKKIGKMWGGIISSHANSLNGVDYSAIYLQVAGPVNSHVEYKMMHIEGLSFPVAGEIIDNVELVDNQEYHTVESGNFAEPIQNHALHQQVHLHQLDPTPSFSSMNGSSSNKNGNTGIEEQMVLFPSREVNAPENFRDFSTVQAVDQVHLSELNLQPQLPTLNANSNSN